MADRDPPCDLNNFLQNVNGTNLTQFLQFSSVQQGPNNQAVHIGTYTFRGVVVGTGTGTARGVARRNAADMALQHLHAHGVPE